MLELKIFYYYYVLMAVPMSYESSWARDQIRPQSVTYATVAATMDP